MAMWGTRTALKGSWDKARSGQEDKWAAGQMGNSGAPSRQVVNEQKDRCAREGGMAKPDRE